MDKIFNVLKGLSFTLVFPLCVVYILITTILNK